MIGPYQGQWDNPQGVWGGGSVRNSAKACGILSFSAVFLVCTLHHPTSSHFTHVSTQMEARKPHFYRAAALSMGPNKGIYGATPPEFFLGALQCFSCSVVLPALEGTEQLESSAGMRGCEEKSFPRTCLEVVVMGGRRSS